MNNYKNIFYIITLLLNINIVNNIKNASDYYKQEQKGTLTSYGHSENSFKRIEGYHCSNGGDCPPHYGCSSFGLCERNE